MSGLQDIRGSVMKNIFSEKSTEDFHETIDFGKITDWSRYPGEVICVAHGDYIPRHQSLYAEWRKRSDAYFKAERKKLKAQVKKGDLAAIAALQFKKLLQTSLKGMCISSFEVKRTNG